MLKKLLLVFLVSIFLISSLVCGALAKYPEKLITFIVGYSAGGSTDIMARLLAEGLEEVLGQKIIILNKEGAAGELAWTELANAKPDGYTIGTINLPGMIANTIIRPDTTKYSVDDFELIANIVLDPDTCSVNSNSPFQNLNDLIEYAREHPKAVTIGNDGIGTSSYMDYQYIDSIMNIETTKVPFGGAAESSAALLGNHIMASGLHLGEVSQYLNVGSLRALGVMMEERSPDYPDIPTFKEQGVDIVSASARGIIVPKGVSKEIIELLTNATKKVFYSDEFQKKAKDLWPLVFMANEQYKKFFEGQQEFAKKLFELTGN